MLIYITAFLIGVVAGLRAMTAPTAASWAAYLGWINLENSWLAFLGYAYTPYIFSALAIGELITDQLPSTPSRKVPIQFGTRILTGALSGAAIGASQNALIIGLILGIIGAIIGTLGGADARKRLVEIIGGKDLPIALLEDLVAVGGAFLIVFSLSK